MSATMESVMNGYKDPRIGEYFSPVGSTGDAAYIGKYNGIRNGSSTTDLGLAENQNKNNSNVGVRFLPENQFTNPRIVLTYAEACFLLAEAKLKGYVAPGMQKPGMKMEFALL